LPAVFAQLGSAQYFADQKWVVGNGFDFHIVAHLLLKFSQAIEV